MGANPRSLVILGPPEKHTLFDARLDNSTLARPGSTLSRLGSALVGLGSALSWLGSTLPGQGSTLSGLGSTLASQVGPHIDPTFGALAASQKELLGRFGHKAVRKRNLRLLFTLVLEGLQNWIFKGFPNRIPKVPGSVALGLVSGAGLHTCGAGLCTFGPGSHGGWSRNCEAQPRKI